MKYIAIIPSRYGSTRLPAKALISLCGKPMFWHVYTRTKACPTFDAVYIATDDERISSVAEELGVPYIMTSKEHTSGTDRIYEAVHNLGISKNTIIANVQGDEPLVHPNMLNQLLSPFTKDTSVQVSTLITPLAEEHLTDPNRVKVVCNKNNDALYFSRSCIPYNRSTLDIPYMGHIGLYAFTYSALEKYVHFPQTLLEQYESLEQLRFLYNGIPIRTVGTEYSVHSVDEAQDLLYVTNRLEEERTLYGY